MEEKSSGGGSGGSITYYTVKFEENGGTDTSDVKVARNTKLAKPADPTKDGYIFEGWYTDEATETPYNFERIVTQGLTLHAKWRKANVSDVLNTADHFAYIKGYQDNTVRPEDNITRAETTEIFYRLLDDEIRNKNIADENSFKDTDLNAWYNTSVSTMTAIGTVVGRTKDTFAPDEFITRAEFAVICARFDNSEYEVAHTFADVENHWAENEIYEAAAHGWIEGYDDGTFRPDEFITRAEAITMINRMLDRTPKTAGDLHQDMVKWADNNDENAWYYIAVQEAANNHSYTKDADGIEKWEQINK